MCTHLFQAIMTNARVFKNQSSLNALTPHSLILFQANIVLACGKYNVTIRTYIIPKRSSPFVITCVYLHIIYLDNIHKFS